MAWLSHVVAGLFIYLSSFNSLIKLGGIVFLIYQLRVIYRCPIPNYPYQKLCFQSKKWQLYDGFGNQLTFEKHRVILEAGIFFLLELSTVEQRKVMVIFFDQLSADMYRSLKLIEKVN